jgi:uncharacterized Zn finger protein
MSRHYGGWAPYVPVAVRRRKAEREMEKVRKKGAVVSPVKIEGRQIARTFWGKAWCDNLESYRDYESRLPRGRTYVRNGSVLDLHIARREVTAMVSGSEIYRVKVSIGGVIKAHWKALCTDCSGGIDSLVELLQGRFSKGVMERICRQDTGLFPRPSEIRFTCSCPDHASMCKHIAAVLYGVGARLDQSPELLFLLRAVDETELLSDLGTALPDTRTERDAANTLAGDDLAALFGLDMVEGGVPVTSLAADVMPADARRKPRKIVAARPATSAVPSTATPANAAKRVTNNTVPRIPPAPKKVAAEPAKSRATLTKASPKISVRKSRARAASSTPRQSEAISAVSGSKRDENNVKRHPISVGRS